MEPLSLNDQIISCKAGETSGNAFTRLESRTGVDWSGLNQGYSFWGAGTVSSAIPVDSRTKSVTKGGVRLETKIPSGFGDVHESSCLAIRPTRIPINLPVITCEVNQQIDNLPNRSFSS